MTYLETLNPEQGRAVEHGVATNGANIAAPLLVIAGAGSGKTQTLSHRVAHLTVNGADRGRILLLTFSNRIGRSGCKDAWALAHGDLSHAQVLFTRVRADACTPRAATARRR